MSAEIIGLAVGAGLTLLTFGYLLGDVPLVGTLFKAGYRLALHIFIGTLVGCVFGIVVHEVGINLILRYLTSDPVILVPLLMGMGLFFFKRIKRLAYVGNFFLAYLIGVGIAVALAGALQGTLIPQVEATSHALSLQSSNPIDLIKGLTIVAGTICTLMAFNSTTQGGQGLARLWNSAVRLMAKVGRWFLIFVFGITFAGALTTALSIFISRIQFLIDAILAVANLSGL